MLSSQLFEISPSLLGCAAIVLLLSQTLYNRYCNGINHIPGPFWASCTDLWRLYHAWTRRPELAHISLHERYGPIVRLGPKSISVSDPQAVPVIYALNSGFIKSDFYLVQQTLAKGRRLFTLFTSTDEKFHAKLRRAVSNAYAMSTLVQFEQYIDSTTTAFLSRMKQRFVDRPGTTCNFSTWLQWYAFDVIGELTFSKPLGFIEQARDIEGIIGSIEKMLDYAAVVGQWPFLDNVFLKNPPIRIMLSKYGLINANTFMVDFARRRLSERLDAVSGVAKKSPDMDSYVRNDFLSRFLAAHEKDSDFITKDSVLALTVANIFAGSDTTAISLRAVFYFLLKNPMAMGKLLDELFEQRRIGNFKRSDGLVDWNEVRELPYLSAVIQEALRKHPAVGLTLERVTPSQGSTVCEQFIPGGTIIGCNAWAIHRNTRIFGSGTDEFRPERWIDCSKEQRRLMDNSLFTFGAGSRTCIGKNISLLEMYKFVPAVLMAYEISLPSQDSEWTLHNAWFVKQSDVLVTIRTRPSC